MKPKKKRKQNFKLGGPKCKCERWGDLMKKKKIINKLLPTEFFPCEFGLDRRVNLQIANFGTLSDGTDFKR
jgi:hypothetical protein